MLDIPAALVGKIILKTLNTYPELFTGNKTLGNVFAIVRNDTTILSRVSNATGLTWAEVEGTIDLYLTVETCLSNWNEAAATASSTNVTFNGTALCKPEISQGYFTVLTLFPALFIILLLSFLNPRKRKIEVFGRVISRPGLCIPVNLVDSYENRFAFACAFGATTGKCIIILLGRGYSEVFPHGFTTWLERPDVPAFLGIFKKILAMFTIGFAYYPLFACMATNYKITGYVIGVLYSAFWLLIKYSRYAQCSSLQSEVFRADKLLLEFPIFLCLSFLFVKYLWLLGIAIYTKCRPGASSKDEVNEWKTFYKYRYVMKLLQPVPKEYRDEESFKQKLRGKVYQWKPEFKYSTRVVCTYFISFIGIYMILLGFVQLAIHLLQLRAQIYNDEVLASLDRYIDVDQWLFIGAVSLLVAIAVAAVYSAILMANTLSWYRGHLLRLQRGEKHFLPLDIFKKDPPSITVATLKYSGFQVAYLCWGTTVILITLSTIGFIAGLQLILPVVDGRFDSWLWVQIRNIWPAIAFSLIFHWIQFLLSKYVFLIDRGATMALNNRRLFLVCTFFLFFFNIFLGLFSCLKRVVIGAVIGVLFLGRTQKSVLSRDFELRDPGFNAYVGYLLLEHTHANPVLVTFCQLLTKPTNDQQILTPKESDGAAWNHVDENEDIAIDMETLQRKTIDYRRVRKIRNRWHLFVTLHNNPSLREHRRSELFVERSPFAAIGIMVQRGVVQFSDITIDREGDEKFDTNL